MYVSLRRLLSLVSVSGLACLLTPAFAAEAESSDKSLKSRFELEFGPAWRSTFDVRAPRDSGDTFSIQEVDDNVQTTAKATMEFFVDKHEWLIGFNPYGIQAKGQLEEDVSFNGKTYATGVDTEAVYYYTEGRLQYLYALNAIKEVGFFAKVGGVLAARDFYVRMYNETNGQETAKSFLIIPHVKTQLGFQYKQFSLYSDLEYGQLRDNKMWGADLTARYDVTETWDWSLGARVHGGIVDDHRIYSDYQFTTAYIKVGYSFDWYN